MYVQNFILDVLRSFKTTENTASLLTAKWDVDFDFGKALDHIGEIFNTPRFGLTDEEYRTKLLGVIAVNTSKGDVEDLIRVFKIITNAIKVRVINIGNGLFDVELQGDEVYNIDVINQIPAGGTRINHVYLYDSGTFEFDNDNLGFDQGELNESITI